MNAIEAREVPESFPPIFLQLDSTDFPGRSLPKGPNGERLSLPTAARLQVEQDGLRIDLIAVEDHGGYYSSDYEPPDFDDPDPPIISMSFRKEKILRLTIGQNYHGVPTANVLIEDPTHVVEGFSLKFQSTDSNNRDYWILLLRKGLVERMGIPVEESTQPARDDFMPF